MLQTLTINPQWIAPAVAVLGFVSATIGSCVRQSVRTNRIEGIVMDLKEANLHTRVSTLEQLVNDIRVSISKLAMLDAINAKQELTITEIRDMRSQIVPRQEHEARWNSFDKRLSELEDNAPK